MRTMVTGGAGFIGSTLVDRLVDAGHTVDVVDNLATGRLENLERASTAAGDRLAVHRMDIRDPATADLIADRGPDVVYHLAAQADVRVSVSDPSFDTAVNVLGTIHVLEGARRAGTGKVLFASSGGTIYGDPGPEFLPLREDQPRRPLSPYGAAKSAVIDYLGVYEALHGLRWTALALANVYGPRQDALGEAGVVAIFGGLLLGGRPCTIFGDGCQTRDFVYVDDVADAFILFSTTGDGLLVNIGTGTETSVNELHATMSSLVGHAQAAVFAAARPGELQRSAVDPSLAASLGWVPKTALRAGLQAVLDSLSSSSP